jgi:hypothetical protein
VVRYLLVGARPRANALGRVTTVRITDHFYIVAIDFTP